MDGSSLVKKKLGSLFREEYQDVGRQGARSSYISMWIGGNAFHQAAARLCICTLVWDSAAFQESFFGSASLCSLSRETQKGRIHCCLWIFFQCSPVLGRELDLPCGRNSNLNVIRRWGPKPKIGCLVGMNYRHSSASSQFVLHQNAWDPWDAHDRSSYYDIKSSTYFAIKAICATDFDEYSYP